jgi:hypothetical protein
MKNHIASTSLEDSTRTSGMPIMKAAKTIMGMK